MRAVYDGDSKEEPNLNRQQVQEQLNKMLDDYWQFSDEEDLMLRADVEQDVPPPEWSMTTWGFIFTMYGAVVRWAATPEILHNVTEAITMDVINNGQEQLDREWP